MQLVEELCQRFHAQLASQGYVARAGQMIDATFVEAPRQRNSRDENAQSKAGTPPADWPEHKRRQQEVAARWTKKNHEPHYGYKNHVNADEAHQLVRDVAVTNAAVPDSQVFDELLEQTMDEDGHQRAVYADSAYRSEAHEEKLAADQLPSRICEKGPRGHPLTDPQQATNRIKSVRVRVEHVFGAQAQSGGHLVRTIGLARAQVKIGLMDLVYNMTRLGQLLRRDAKRLLCPDPRRGACSVA